MSLKGPPAVASASALPLMLICRRKRSERQLSAQLPLAMASLTAGCTAVLFTGITCPTVEIPTEVQLRMAVPWGSNSGKMSCEEKGKDNSEQHVSGDVLLNALPLIATHGNELGLSELLFDDRDGES